MGGNAGACALACPPALRVSLARALGGPSSGRSLAVSAGRRLHSCCGSHWALHPQRWYLTPQEARLTPLGAPLGLAEVGGKCISVASRNHHQEGGQLGRMWCSRGLQLSCACGQGALLPSPSRS